MSILTTHQLTFRALLVEDREADMRWVRESFVQYPIAFDHASTLEGALERVRVVAYDVVLLDLSLGDSHGIDTVRAMAPHHGAIVVLTGRGNGKTGELALVEGAEDYVPKGCDAALLWKSIQLVRERRLRRIAEARVTPFD